MSDLLMTEQMCRSRKSLRVHHIIKHSKWVVECECWRCGCISFRHGRAASTVCLAAGGEPASVGQGA